MVEVKSYTLDGEEKEYLEFLKWLRENKKMLKSVMGQYKDPDMYSDDLYDDLCKFLNKREKNFLHGSYEYVKSGRGIEVYETGKKLMRLVSDQFGFSAPRIELNHIYDDYLVSEDFSGDYDSILNWIKSSRTLGGSFLWPKNKDGDINTARGGTNIYRKNYPLQDRVDLTLMEIKGFLDNDEESCLVISKVVKKCPELGVWLRHFGNFQTFSKFFMFDVSGFVKNGEVVKLEHMEDKTKEKDNIYELSQDEKKEMLDDLCRRIEKRSEEMEEAIGRKA